MAQALVAEALKVPVIASTEVDRPDDLEYDLLHLCAVDPHPIDVATFKSNPGEYLTNSTRDVAQLIINKLFALPSRSAEQGRLATLPTKSTAVLPREKPIPKPKPLTKWEKFAQEKGIQKRKKDKVVFDDMLGEWRPTFGRDRANNVKDEWVIESKPGDDPKVDPFLKKQQDKKARAKKGKEAQLKNVQEAAKELGRPVPGSMLLTNKRLAKGYVQREKMRKSDKDDYMDTFKMAHFASASMGKFDNKLKQAPKTISLGKRKRVDDVLAEGEKEKTMKILNRVITAKGHDKVTHLTSKATKVVGRITMKDKAKAKKQHLIAQADSGSAGKKKSTFKKAKY